VLVLRSGGRFLALAVDVLHGKDEFVIKGLGGFPEGVGPFSSGTISGDGRVILVLNPARLMQPGGGRSLISDGRARVEPDRTDETRRFLLVDDSISVRKFVGQMLERSGFAVVTAGNGAEALQQLETTAIHAVITDLEMPNGNGYELIEHLRRRPSTRDLPIVVLTTRSGDKHQELARRLGVTHYLTKPVEETAFIELMASLVPRPIAAPTEPDGLA
jgi:chemosensory pili system protein ChpA (sensor histidine kinase/response regulator)